MDQAAKEAMRAVTLVAAGMIGLALRAGAGEPQQPCNPPVEAQRDGDEEPSRRRSPRASRTIIPIRMGRQWTPGDPSSGAPQYFVGSRFSYSVSSLDGAEFDMLIDIQQSQGAGTGSRNISGSRVTLPGGRIARVTGGSIVYPEAAGCRYVQGSEVVACPPSTIHQKDLCDADISAAFTVCFDGGYIQATLHDLPIFLDPPAYTTASNVQCYPWFTGTMFLQDSSGRVSRPETGVIPQAGAKQNFPERHDSKAEAELGE